MRPVCTIIKPAVIRGYPLAEPEKILKEERRNTHAQVRELKTVKPYFGKQVIERERRNSGERSLKMWQVGRMDEEGDYDGPARVPMSRGAGHRYNKKIRKKDFSDVLSPVVRYLRGQIGQPWDKVYSELVGALGAGNWPMQHILYQHILTRRAGVLEGPLSLYGNEGRFHVDQAGRVRLEQRESWKREARKAKEPLRKVEIGEGRYFVAINGIWYIGRWVEGECAMRMSSPAIDTPYQLRAAVWEPVWPDYATGYGLDAKRFRFVKEKQANWKELRDLRARLLS